jgi:hypothetical protein
MAEGKGEREEGREKFFKARLHAKSDREGRTRGGEPDLPGRRKSSTPYSQKDFFVSHSDDKLIHFLPSFRHWATLPGPPPSRHSHSPLRVLRWQPAVFWFLPLFPLSFLLSFFTITLEQLKSKKDCICQSAFGNPALSLSINLHLSHLCRCTTYWQQPGGRERRKKKGRKEVRKAKN